jgi:hypothetical protein
LTIRDVRKLDDHVNVVSVELVIVTTKVPSLKVPFPGLRSILKEVVPEGHERLMLLLSDVLPDLLSVKVVPDDFDVVESDFEILVELLSAGLPVSAFEEPVSEVLEDFVDPLEELPSAVSGDLLFDGSDSDFVLLPLCWSSLLANAGALIAATITNTTMTTKVLRNDRVPKICPSSFSSSKTREADTRGVDVHDPPANLPLEASGGSAEVLLGKTCKEEGLCLR